MVDLSYNVTGQEVFFDCSTRPTSVTSVEVYEMATGDDGTAESALDTPAIESAPDTTVDAASGYSQTDPKLVSLTATTGIEIGRSYLLTNSEGASEWVEVVEIDDGASVTVSHPLANDYGVGATFESTRITVAVLDDWIEDENNISDDNDPNPSYRVRWTFVADGSTKVRDTYLDVVRYKGLHTVRPIDVDDYSPGFLESLPRHHQIDSGARLIQQAYDRGVVVDLMEVGVADEMLRNRSVVNTLVILKTLERRAGADYENGQGDPDRVAYTMEQYERRLQKLVGVTNRVARSTSASGAGHMPVAQGFWGK